MSNQIEKKSFHRRTKNIPRLFENLISMCSSEELLLLLRRIFDSKSWLIQYLSVFTLDFDDNSARVVKGGRKLNKCPEMESSGKRYGVGDIKRTAKKIKVTENRKFEI